MISTWLSKRVHSLLLILAIPAISSCSMVISNSLIEPTVTGLQQQTDLELVCEGSPAYLLMIDSMIASDKEDTDLLRVGAQAYSGYVAAIEECGIAESRVKAIADKGKRYGVTLLDSLIPLNTSDDQEQFQAELKKLRRGDVPELFWGTLAWLNWIKVQKGAPAAMADLVTVQSIMARLLELDESYQAGGGHLFFGVYYATRPPMLGGDPERSRSHFEKALIFSRRSFLLTQVAFAETLARQLFDQELHDRLLLEVIQFDLDKAPQYALSNQIAKRKAKRLLEEEYFAD